MARVFTLCRASLRRSWRLAVLTLALAAWPNFAHAAVAASITPVCDKGTKKEFGNYITPKGTYVLSFTDGDHATLKKIEVKLQVFDIDKKDFKDITPFQPATPGAKNTWSASDYFFLPAPAQYRVFARMTYDQVVGGVMTTGLTKDGVEIITFNK